MGCFTCIFFNKLTIRAVYFFQTRSLDMSHCDLSMYKHMPECILIVLALIKYTCI